MFKNRKPGYLGHILRGELNCFQQLIRQDKIEGGKRSVDRGKRYMMERANRMMKKMILLHSNLQGTLWKRSKWKRYRGEFPWRWIMTANTLQTWDLWFERMQSSRRVHIFLSRTRCSAYFRLYLRWSDLSIKIVKLSMDCTYLAVHSPFKF